MGCRKLQLNERFFFLEATTTLTYSKTGQLLSITNDDSTVEYKYDDFNRVTLESSENGTVAYKYNSKGLLASKKVSVSSLRSPSAKSSAFTTTYAYDDLDRLTTVESPAGKYVYQYNKLGRVKSLTMGSAKVAFTYDKAGRLTAKTLIVGKKKTIIAAYKYDKLNRRISATVLDTAWKYKYDKKNQLIGAVADNSNGKQVFKYGFDSIGNRLSYSTALSEETFKYNDLNQLANKQYKYDKFGNLTSTPDATYKYNLNNRLVEVRKKDVKLTFAYDGNGRRISKKVFDNNGKLFSDTQFLYSGFKCVAEIDALNNKVTRFYSWQGEQLLGVVDTKSGKHLACLTDGNKNVVGLIDNSGEITAKFAYSPFGKLISAKGADAQKCGFGFSSEYRDSESGLVYYNYRYLNPRLGRWMTRDPIGEQGGNSNLYAMVSNTPTTAYDHFGLEEKIILRFFDLGPLPVAEWEGKFIWECGAGNANIDNTPGWTGVHDFGGTIFDYGFRIWYTATPVNNSRWTTDGCDKCYHRYLVRLKVQFTQHATYLYSTVDYPMATSKQNVDCPCVKE